MYFCDKRASYAQGREKKALRLSLILPFGSDFSDCVFLAPHPHLALVLTHLSSSLPALLHFPQLLICLLSPLGQVRRGRAQEVGGSVAISRFQS